MTPRTSGTLSSIVLAFLLASSFSHAFQQPSEVRFSGDTETLTVWLRWSEDPDFPADAAAEFEVLVDDKCYAGPKNGYDNTTDLASMGVESNLEHRQPDLEPYVDVWNYRVPGTPDEAYADVGRSCGMIDAIGAKAKFENIGDSDTFGNFAIGVRRADRIRQNTWYWFSYSISTALTHLDPDECTSRAWFSRASLHVAIIPNTCTYAPWGIRLVESYCPFFLGAPTCAEAGSLSDHNGYYLTQRVCLPYSALGRFLPDAEPSEPGDCVDGDHDFLLRVCGNEDCTLSMLGDYAQDCNDEDGHIGGEAYSFYTRECHCSQPPSGEVCGDFIDNDCNGIHDCDEAVCSSSTECLGCGELGDVCCVGGSCSGDYVCIDGTCIDAAPDCGIEGNPCCDTGDPCIAGLDCDATRHCVLPDTAEITCFDGLQNQGEGGIDCGGPCELPCCPFGNGAYCDSTHTDLLDCVDGVYSVLEDCRGLGCYESDPGEPDYCNCSDGVCEPDIGETCSTCATDCCVASPQLVSPADGAQFVAGSSVTLSWAPAAPGTSPVEAARWRYKVCSDEALSCTPVELIAPNEADTSVVIPNPDVGVRYWQVQGIGAGGLEDADWGTWSLVRTFSVVDSTGGTGGTSGTGGTGATAGSGGMGGAAGAGGGMDCTGHYWCTDFEEAWWPRTSGGTTLPNDIEVVDMGGPVLVTEVSEGNPGQALAWYGAASYQPYEAARFSVPVVLDTALDATLAFDAYLTADGPRDIRLYVQRGTCGPPTIRTLQRGDWRTISVSLPACAYGTGVVVYVGEIYEFPSDAVALRVDNVIVDVADTGGGSGGSVTAGGTGGQPATGGTTGSGGNSGTGGTTGTGGAAGTAGEGGSGGGCVDECVAPGIVCLDQATEAVCVNDGQCNVVTQATACDSEETCVDGLGCSACVPGTVEDCYTGTTGTEDIGACHGGTRTCGTSGVWGACEGQVTDAPETCSDQAIDNNCDGDPSELSDGIHEGDPCMTGMPGACAEGAYACNGTTLACLEPLATGELCDGEDRDCDGLLDCDDPDCAAFPACSCGHTVEVEADCFDHIHSDMPDALDWYEYIPNGNRYIWTCVADESLFRFQLYPAGDPPEGPWGCENPNNDATPVVDPSCVGNIRMWIDGNEVIPEPFIEWYVGEWSPTGACNFLVCTKAAGCELCCDGSDDDGDELVDGLDPDCPASPDCTW